MHDVAKRSDLEGTARALFAAIADGALDANVDYEQALEAAVKTDQAIEHGTTLGAAALIP